MRGQDPHTTSSSPEKKIGKKTLSGQMQARERCNAVFQDGNKPGRRQRIIDWDLSRDGL